MSTREELLGLAKGLRAHLEWQVETGVTGLPHARDRIAPSAPKESRAAGPTVLADATLAASRGDHAAAPAPLPEPVNTALPRAGPVDVHEQLRVLSLEVSGCSRCALHRTRRQTVFARGNPQAELCFVGEGPGADEDEQGLPFVGKAGQLLDRMIGAMGYARDEVYVCNIVKCRPPENRKPEPAEMSACAPFLRKQIEMVAPKVIVALGATAVEGLLGAGGGITRMRGQWKLYRAVPLMPTFHPAYLLRNPLAKREVWADLQAVLKQLGRVAPPADRGS